MKKAAIVLLVLILQGCKTTKTHCDAYGEVEYDIHKTQLESQKKYTTVCTLK
jgi:hypothetical protein